MSKTLGETVAGTTVRGKIYRMLIALFAIMLIATASYLAYSQRLMVEDLVDAQATDLANSYFDNINTLMLTGGMANREIPRKKVLSREEVLDARIIRSPATTKIYGPGSDYAQVKDDLDRRALAGETIQQFSAGTDGRVLTVLLPLTASTDFRGTNCIACHMASDGEVLGAVRVEYSLAKLDAAVNRDLLINIGINSALMIAGLIVIGMFFTRIVSNPLRQLGGKLQAVAEGSADLSQRVDVSSRDEIGNLARYFNLAVEKFARIVDETQRQSEAATRIKTALDCVSTNVMVADGDFNIIYMNEAVKALFKDAESDLRERLPHFDADHLVGKNIDIFHADPAHQRRLLSTLSETYESQVEVGPRTFRIVANPVIDAHGERLGTAVEWADLTAELRAADEQAARLETERRYANENLRIRTALDNVGSAVMVADEDYNIIYLNKTLDAMFRDAESDLRTVLPSFSVDKLIGSNMDAFHRDRSHQRRLLDNARSTVGNEIEVAGLTLRVVANPVRDAQGNRLGTVVEWANRTAEVAVEKEIDAIVAAARRGDLTDRVGTNDKKGFFLQLAEGINDLLGIVDSVFHDIAASMRKMADGDMTKPIENDYSGSFGQVKEDVNATLANVGKIVRDLRDAADAITTGAGEISSGNNNLSARTEQQASALEETAASMEQLTSTVRNNAANAQQANELARTASRMATQGGDVVGRAVVAMSEINSSSTKIAEIIGVIDEIAFQTNLLALNASVEAARAGEQGRGFAVVATEVRNLAGRSASAAKEIKDLIRDSVDKVHAGTELVDESGRTLDEIVDSVKKVGDIIAEIAAASTEQSAGIDQVNRAVASMDEVTQQNAALAEQTSAASSSMSDKASEMATLVGFFKVDESRSAAVAAKVVNASQTTHKSASQSGSTIARSAAASVEKSTPAGSAAGNRGAAGPAARPASGAMRSAAAAPHAKPAQPGSAKATGKSNLPSAPKAQRKAVAPPPELDDDEWEEF